MKVLLFAVALVIVYLLTRSESFQETIGDGFVEQKSQISPNQNESMIQLVKAKLKEHLGLCGYCIETNKIQTFSNGTDVKYKARYMFLIFATYPYGLAVDVEIKDGKVTSFKTQQADNPTTGDFVAYTDEVAHEFLSYDQLAQKPSPIISNVTKE